MTRSRFPWPAYLVLAMGAGGCVPIVSHGPVVDPGVGFAATGAVGLVSGFLTECHTGLTSGPGEPYVYERECPGPRATLGLGSHLALRFGGQPSEDGGMTASIGVQAPGGVDLHAGFPARDGGLDRGVGVMVSLLHLSPYFQAGRWDGERGWHTTQLLWLLNPLETEKDYFTPGVFWAPSLSYQVAAGTGSRMTYRAGGYVGVEFERHRPDGRRPAVPAWGVTLSATAEPFRR